MNQGISVGLLFLALACLAVEVVADEPPKARSLRVDLKCEIDKLPPGSERVDLWIPIPPSDKRQTVEWLNERELKDGRVTTEKTFGNRLFYQRFDLSDHKLPIDIALSFNIEVREATVEQAKQLISTSAEVPAEEFAAYLRDTSMIPLNGRIAELARGIDLPGGEPLKAGRAIYDYLVDSMKYNYLAPGAGKGDAVWACDSKTGDCTDFHSVFIGACRWRGIPADHVFGLPLPPEATEGDARHCHCWAQFWVKDIGWIPIDASRANKFPKDREYYFGTLGSTWVTLAHGRDIVLEPPQQGPPLNMLHGPVAEVDGKPFAGLRWVAHYRDREKTDAK